MNDFYKVKKLSISDIKKYKVFENLSDKELEKILEFLYDFAEIAFKEYERNENKNLS
jgi:hypothetical protein